MTAAPLDRRYLENRLREELDLPVRRVIRKGGPE